MKPCKFQLSLVEDEELFSLFKYIVMYLVFSFRMIPYDIPRAPFCKWILISPPYYFYTCSIFDRHVLFFNNEIYLQISSNKMF